MNIMQWYVCGGIRYRVLFCWHDSYEVEVEGPLNQSTLVSVSEDIDKRIGIMLTDVKLKTYPGHRTT